MADLTDIELAENILKREQTPTSYGMLLCEHQALERLLVYHKRLLAMMETGIGLIAAERERQVSVEGYAPEHDDGHIDGEMAVQAAALALHHTHAHVANMGQPVDPWDLLCKARDAGTVRNLVKAGALIAAEIDRLQRAASR